MNEKDFLDSLPDTLMLEDAITEVTNIFAQQIKINQQFAVGKLENYVLFHKELRYGVYKNNGKYFLAGITKPKKTLGIMGNAAITKISQILTDSTFLNPKYVGMFSKLSNSEKAFLEAIATFGNIAREKKSKKREERVLKEKKEKEERKLQEGIEGKKHQEATAEAKPKEKEEQKNIEEPLKSGASAIQQSAAQQKKYMERKTEEEEQKKIDLPISGNFSQPRLKELEAWQRKKEVLKKEESLKKRRKIYRLIFWFTAIPFVLSILKCAFEDMPNSYQEKFGKGSGLFIYVGSWVVLSVLMLAIVIIWGFFKSIGWVFNSE